MSDDTARLTRLATLAEQLGADAAAGDARALATRVAEGRFFLVAVGQFKRGKSTLLNALIGEAILPTGVAPVTSAITVMRYGLDRAAVVVFKDGRRRPIGVDDVPAFVTEARNPENERAVAAVEIFSPTPLLASGMCLVDTPGLGSVFQHNTDATRAFVPHVDAALVVLGIDPPITADELALVIEVSRQVDHLIFVLNKVDRLNADELAEARRFTAGIVARQLNRPNECLFEVSATERLAHGPTRDWTALEVRLRDLTSHTTTVVDHAARRGIARIGTDLFRDLDEQHKALTRPLEESQRRIEALDTSIARATQLLQDLAALLQSEEQRIISQFFDTAQESFVSSSARDLGGEVRRTVEGLASTHHGGALRQAAYAAVRDIVPRRIRTWLTEVEPQAEMLYRHAAGRFVTLANEFLSSLASSGDPSFAHLPRLLDPDAGFRAPRQFYFTDLMHLTAANPATWIFDQVRGPSAAVTAISRDAIRYAERLLTSNSSRVIFDLRERLSESRRGLEADLRLMLKELSASAMRALALARSVRDEGEPAVARELGRLEQHRAMLHALTGEDAPGGSRDACALTSTASSSPPHLRAGAKT
jgi:predicted GTPase